MSGLALGGTALGLASVVSPATAEDPITLTVSYNNSHYTEFLEEIARRFEAAHPGVDVQNMVPVSSEAEHMSRTLRLAVTDDLPDVSLNGYSQIAILQRRGIPVALDGFIADEADWASNGLPPASYDATRVGDGTYGLPVQNATPVLFYNVDLVRRAGGDPENLPTDWEGIIELAERIDALGDTITGGYFDYNASGNWTFQALITSQGQRMMNSDNTELTFDGPEGRRALEIISEFGRTGMVDLTYDQGLQAFVGGQIGIFTQSNTFLDSFERQIDGRFEIRTARWPLSSDDGRVPIGGRAVMMYTTDPEKQQTAWDYLKFMVTPEMQTLLTEMTSTTPVNMISMTDPQYLGNYFSENPNTAPALEQVPYVTEWYAFPGDNANEIVRVIQEHLREVAVNQADVDATLAEMSEDVQALLP